MLIYFSQTEKFSHCCLVFSFGSLFFVINQFKIKSPLFYLQVKILFSFQKICFSLEFQRAIYKRSYSEENIINYWSFHFRHSNFYSGQRFYFACCCSNVLERGLEIRSKIFVLSFNIGYHFSFLRCR